MSFTYIAMPYTSLLLDPEERKAEMQARMVYFWKATGYCFHNGVKPISPMSMEPTYTYCPNMPDIDWHEYSRLLLEKADAMVVIMLPGWEVSAGVLLEIDIAKQRGIPIVLMLPETLDDWYKEKQQ